MPKLALSDFEITPPALYGKLPAHGDFVPRGLSQVAIDVIDAWLSQLIDHARAEWGAEFETYYRSAQPWLFEGGSVSVILLPSMDSVGRLFPFIAIAQVGVDMQSLYDCVIEAISESWSADRLLKALDGLNKHTVGQPVGKWFIPSADEISLPHPTFITGADRMSGVFQ